MRDDFNFINYALSKKMLEAHNTSETAHADIRADLAAEHLNTEKRLAPLEALARTLDTLNPNGEDTVTATTTTGEATLPKNAADGKLGLTVKGVTDGVLNSLPAKITSKDAGDNTVSEAFTPNIVMRSVPDGVADEYNVNTGVFTQKVSKTVFDGSAGENWSVYLSATKTLLLFSLDLSDTMHIPTTDSTNIICDRFTSKLIFSSDEEGIFVGALNGRLYVRILKSRLATPDAAGFRQWLSNNPMTLIYQLAEPIITQYPPQYPKCKGGGSLTVENILGDADFYGEGVTVEGLTFSEVVKVTKIDLENGLETDVTDTCTLNEDKDGFTSTELAAGDICWYELQIDPATTTIPPVDYTYYDSRFVAVDDTDNKMYRWKVVTTNGVARIETEEIV